MGVSLGTAREGILKFQNVAATGARIVADGAIDGPCGRPAAPLAHSVFSRKILQRLADALSLFDDRAHRSLQSPAALSSKLAATLGA
jgi:hypothetical protein